MRDDWHKSADRENARRTAAAPLLANAGLVPLVSPAERQARMESEREAFQRRQQESAVQTAERTAHLLGQVLERIEPADQERVRRYLAAYPVEYGPTLLATMLVRLDAGLTALEQAQAPTPETVAEWRRRGSLVAAIMNSPTPDEQVLLDQLHAMGDRKQGRRALLDQLGELRGRRVRAAGLASTTTPQQAEPEIGVRVVVGDAVHEALVTAEAAPSLTVPAVCPGCAANPLPVMPGMGSDGPKGMAAQAVCRACGATVGRVEAWWLDVQGGG